RVLPVVRDIEAVAADPHLPGRGGCARRRDVAVGLQGPKGDASRRVRLDVKVVEQRGLQTASVERREAGAAGALEEPSVIAAIYDGERTGLRRKHPSMRVGVETAQR